VADLNAFDRFEAAGWETTAAAYDHYWPRLTNRLNDHLLDAVGAGPHARLLDVACGPGYLAGQASDRGATVTGIDVAKAMVEIARRRCPRIEFRQADAQALPFPEASFHAIVGNLAIPHLARPERAAAEFHRVLASNGWLALTTWDLPGRARLVGVLLEAVREVEVIPPETVPTGPDFFRFADNAEFNALLAGQGFTEVEVRSIAFMHPVGSPGELWDGLLHGADLGHRPRPARRCRRPHTGRVRPPDAGLPRRTDLRNPGCLQAGVRAPELITTTVELHPCGRPSARRWVRHRQQLMVDRQQEVVVGGLVSALLGRLRRTVTARHHSCATFAFISAIIA
jgi:ubiquinone/menaquinone biosynthesis C-methylase UbiE